MEFAGERDTIHHLIARIWFSLSAALVLVHGHGFCQSMEAVAEPAGRPLDLSELAPPSFTAYGLRDGLPDGVITAIGVDSDGLAWATSPRGVFRFMVHGFEQKLTSEAGRNHRRLLSHDGEFWIPASDTGISVLEDGQWRHLDESNGLPTSKVYAVEHGPDLAGKHSLWLLTIEDGLFYMVDGEWVPDPDNHALPEGQLITIGVTDTLFGERRQWIGTGSRGLFYRTADHPWRPFEHDALSTGQIEDLKSARNGGEEVLWVSAFGTGLFRLSESSINEYSVANGRLQSDELYTLAVDRSARTPVIWAASRAGVLRIENDRVVAFDRRHGLPSDVARDVSITVSPFGERILWVATEAGVGRAVFGTDRWRTASLLGSGALGVFGVLVEPDGKGSQRLWVASNGDGLGLFENNEWKTFSPATGDLPNHRLRLLTRLRDLDNRDLLWIGVEGGHLMTLDENHRIERVNTPWKTDPTGVPMMMIRRELDGVPELWITTRLSGIYRWRSTGWTGYGTASDTPDPWQGVDLANHVDSQGRQWLWASSYRGLRRFDGQQWVTLRNIPGLPESRYIGLDIHSDNGRDVLWAGTYLDGLIRLDITDPANPVLLDNTDLPPPIDSAVYSAPRDDKGRIYLCTNDGVQMLVPNPGAGPLAYTDRVFRRRDGMVHEECNTNAQFIDEYGRFWTGTLGGLTVFEPGTTSRSPPKELKVMSAAVDEEPVATDTPIVLTPRQHDLNIQFALMSWQREDETRYRTQLIGLDDEPTPWSSRSDVQLSRLPAGDYQLKIESMDYAGTPAEPIYLEIESVPSWWERPAAWVAFLLGAGLLAFAAVSWRDRRVMARQARLEQIVAERTEALNATNDELTRLSFTDELTGLFNRRALLEAMRESFDSNDRSYLIFLDVDHFKRFNDQFGHLTGDEVLVSVATALTEVAPDHALVSRYGGEEFACFINAMAKSEILALAESMRATVEKQTTRAQVAGVTISAGVASCRLKDDADIDALMKLADDALYRAKREGRNRVESTEM